MKIARGVFKLMRHIDFRDVLVWLHLARKPGPAGAVALVGAGAVVGAGLVMLLSPASGREVRGSIKRRTGDLHGLGEKLRHPLREARSGLFSFARRKADDVEERLEHGAESAEEKVSEALRAARDAVKSKLD